MDDEEDLRRMRAAMDVCNLRLAAVLHDRARLVRTIAAWKRARGVAPVDASREERMLADVVARAPADGYPPAALGAIFAAVFAASRDLVSGPS